ncbi:ribonuclease H-like domain-containing protein [Tanacetum coccineum]
MAFVSSPSSINKVNTAYGVSTANTQIIPASTQVSTASTQVSTANLSDATVYAFLANQPNGSQLVHEDLEQIHEDNLEEMDLKWQLALLSMRTRIWDTLQGNAEDIGTKIAGTAIKTALEGLEKEFQQPEFEGYGPKTSKSVSEDISNEVKEYPDASIGLKKSQSPRGNQRNWNNQKSQQLRSDFVMYNKACFVCGSFDHVQADCNYHQRERVGHPQKEDQGYVDSGCLRHMTGNMYYLSDFKDFDGGYVTFGGGAKRGKITSKGTLKTGKLDFEDMYFVKELKFNLFSVSQMCDNKNGVLFIDTGCFDLSSDFKLTDESQVLLKVPRKHNMYSVDMKNIVPKESLTCLVAKATLDESMLWHRRLGHINFKTIIKLVKENLVRGLPTKRFENDQTYVACLKGKQHKAFLTPALSFMRPFGCHVTILNTLNYLGNIDGKSDEGFFVGYSMNSDGPKWLFDIDVLTKSMNYVPVVAGTNSNDFVGTKESIGTSHSSKETGSSQDYILMPLWKDGSLFDSSSKNASNYEPQPPSDAGKKDDEGVCKESGIDDQERPKNNTQDVNTAGPSINTKPVMFSLLVVHGHTQEKGIDYDEVFAPVARIEAIRLFLAYDSFMGFMVYQIDMKSAFLYERIREEVYVCQPPGFEDPNYPDKVYKVVKALYGLHQAPIAWYETLAKYLLDNEFHRGKIDQTLFIKKHKGDILLV